jgi:large subunit ribosomal protein L21
MPYAIIRSGGKQYRVSQGDLLRVEKLDVPVGGDVALNDVLAIGEGSGLNVEGDKLAGQAVQAKVVRHGRGRKVTIWTYKRRKGFARKKGHRQEFTELQVTAIPAGL